MPDGVGQEVLRRLIKWLDLEVFTDQSDMPGADAGEVISFPLQCTVVDAEDERSVLSNLPGTLLRAVK